MIGRPFAERINYVYMVYDGAFPSYVGIGTGHRQDQSRANHGSRVEVIASDLSRSEAKGLERVLVHMLGRKGRDQFGILENRQRPGTAATPRCMRDDLRCQQTTSLGRRCTRYAVSDGVCRQHSEAA